MKDNGNYKQVLNLLVVNCFQKFKGMKIKGQKTKG